MRAGAVRYAVFFVEVLGIVWGLYGGNEWWGHKVELVPGDVFEPTVGFDVLGVVRIYIAASVITVEG